MAKNRTKVNAQTYTEQYLIASVEAALTVLADIARSPDQTLQDISTGCHLSVSQTNRLLHTLIAHGYVIKTPLKRYQLGYAALSLGHQAHLHFPLIEYAAESLDQVLRETQESVHLVQRSGKEAVILDLRESPQNVRVVSQIGKRGPLYLGGSGRLFLTYDDPKLLEDTLHDLRSSPNPQRAETLTTELQQIKAQGYSIARGDFEADAFSIAAPIFTSDNRIIGCLAIAGPLTRLTAAHEAALITCCTAAARRIENTIKGQLKTFL